MLHILNIISFICAFVGTLIVYQFGVPNQIDTGGKISLALEQEDEEEKKKISKYKFFSKLGLLLIAFGFFFRS
jgi:hypothetical protein